MRPEPFEALLPRAEVSERVARHGRIVAWRANILGFVVSSE